jgi:predicted nucleic-acid-binding Zn-ribbon protein
MQVPEKCPKCGSKLEYLAEVHLIGNTDPQEAGIEGNCFKCGTMIYSKFKMFEAELTLFDEDGNEIETKKI